jgi:hypothetical protein
LDYASLSAFIGQVGFPVFVSILMLTKGTKVIENNTAALNQNTQAIQALKENCNKKGN